ncbi:MAG: hypothetical protein QNL62_15960 [Gammaproteobacteria bacterium]|nr:hypothetical protein [Gammaproteobacteria bacterium]
MKILLSIILLSTFISQNAFSQDLEEKKIYRLDKSVHNLKRTRDDQTGFIALQKSKFIVVDTQTDPNAYIVRFIKIYDHGDTLSTVTEDEEYKLNKLIGGTAIIKSVQVSLTGPVSGPLIVPFKYRTDDDSLSGEATIGYYAGYRTEFKMPLTNTRIPVSPFIAGGLSQINVSTNGDTDNKSGVTIAVGFLIQNWADVNIGFVYGQDRIGDSSWEHEGDGWISFMIGWDI